MLVIHRNPIKAAEEVWPTSSNKSIVSFYTGLYDKLFCFGTINGIYPPSYIPRILYIPDGYVT